jgi:phytol kinase
MLFGGFIFAAAVVWIFVLAGKFEGPFSAYLLPITVISIVGAFVETLPVRDVDNLTVTAAAVALGHLFF